MKLGFIGFGVVGSAVYEAFKADNDCRIYDPNKGYINFKRIKDTEIVFVSVPVPTLIDGSIDLNILEQILTKLNKARYEGVVVIKSTVLPGTCNALKHLYKLRIVHNPEFLTERNAKQDFAKQKCVLLSGDSNDVKVVVELYRDFNNLATILSYPQYRVTETAKYVHNCFLAVKVSFFNEIYEFCQASDIEYRDVLMAALSQHMIGINHTQVPGPDGLKGYGGTCFPKDTHAWANHSVRQGVLPSTVIAACAGNKKRRGL